MDQKNYIESCGLSFVFKIHDCIYKPTKDGQGPKITWRDYRKPSKHPDIQEVYKLDQQTVSTRDPEPDSEINIDGTPFKQGIILTSLVKKILFDYFKTKNIIPEEIDWFMQTEYSENTELHIHVILHSDKIDSKSGKWMCKYFGEKWGLMLCTVLNMPKENLSDFFNQTKFRQTVENDEWVQVLQYTHPQTKKKYCKPVNFGEIIHTYFLSKKPILQKANGECGYIYSSDSGFRMNSLCFNDRWLIHQHLRELSMRKETTQIQTISPQDKKKKRLETAKEQSIKETIYTLTKNKLHTAEKWMLGDPDSYIQHIANPGGETVIKATLDIVTLKMSVEKTAYQLIIESKHEKIKHIKKCKAWKLMKDNNFNPKKIWHCISCALNKQMGKRNTILLCGPASTGKSLLAQKIAQLVGNVGCYNPSNVNFPFNDCSNRNLIWVEEAGNFGGQVNQFKAIMSGQSIRLDQKGKGSKAIEPTPVIMTTNEDITKVIIGSETKPEHKQPIMDRCCRIEMKKRLEGDFGLLEDGEIPSIFKWLESKAFLPTMANYCARWGAPPTWGENWNTKPKELGTELISDEETEPETSKPNLYQSLDPTGLNADFQLLLQDIEETEKQYQQYMEPTDEEIAELAETGYGQALIDGTAIQSSTSRGPLNASNKKGIRGKSLSL
ncbi:nonstructural protein 1 [Wuharv (rhesus) parvovirus 1]|uniref:Initiator protein NS1 n=1 Tax=Wuharv (rhesus) parvovirus 1 TaxID=1245561 RepID=K4NWE5_9VIRU|nr:nonstructural protein 1 [Wuharv parvovirus 1]AFV48069.1 nonstructural protein 1 [Wuharv parvovirus 1]